MNLAATIKAVVAAVLALLVAKGVLLPGASTAIIGVVNAVLVLLSAFAVHPFGTKRQAEKAKNA